MTRRTWRHSSRLAVIRPAGAELCGVQRCGSEAAINVTLILRKSRTSLPSFSSPSAYCPAEGVTLDAASSLFCLRKTDVRSLPVPLNCKPHLRSPYWLGGQGELIWEHFLDAFESICVAELSSIFWSAYAVRVAEGNEGGRCVNTRKTHRQHQEPPSGTDSGLDKRERPHRRAHSRASVRPTLISTSCFPFLIHPSLIFLSLYMYKQARVGGWMGEGFNSRSENTHLLVCSVCVCLCLWMQKKRAPAHAPREEILT